MPMSFNIPATVITGAGASAELGALVQRLSAHRVLLVTDRFLVGNGVVGPLCRPSPPRRRRRARLRGCAAGSHRGQRQSRLAMLRQVEALGKPLDCRHTLLLKGQ